MPYRTVDDRIDGVVITFADITTAKRLEAKLRGGPGSRKVPAVEPGERGVTGGRFKSEPKSALDGSRKVKRERKPKKS